MINFRSCTFFNDLPLVLNIVSMTLYADGVVLVAIDKNDHILAESCQDLLSNAFK